jgi:glycerol-3-phosphate dehydrogenase
LAARSGNVVLPDRREGNATVDAAPLSNPVLERERSFASLGAEHDLLVVGGGVNGLAIAWNAALAGLDVVVIDKGDWGSGTSSWSSRMIHGGVKYLEKYDVRLVRESLRDREWLLQHAPHLVKPLPFLLPFFKGGAHSKLLLRLGMIAYDVLSFDKSLPRHKNFSRDELIELMPGIRREGLQGASRFFDAQVEYAERLCVELMLGARGAGATALNHTRLASLTMAGNRVTGARLVDQLTSEEYHVRAGVTINVAGAWADDIVAGTPAADRRWIGGTKGTHLVVDEFEGAPHEAMYFESEDGRPMLVIPWLGRYLLGSTDEVFSGDLDTVHADDAEIAYILAETNRLFPTAELTPASVLYSYTGVRPLPYVDAERTADISRRHEIHDHAPEVEGLLTVVGGKLTTFRALSNHAMKAIGRKTSVRAIGRPLLKDQFLPGSAARTVTLSDRVPTDVAQRLIRVYGARAADIDDLIAADPTGLTILDPTTLLIAAEVTFVVRTEQALRVADVLSRRTMVGLDADLGRGAAPAVARIMANELGWDEARTGRELALFEAYLARFENVGGDEDVLPAGD